MRQDEEGLFFLLLILYIWKGYSVMFFRAHEAHRNKKYTNKETTKV